MFTYLPSHSSLSLWNDVQVTLIRIWSIPRSLSHTLQTTAAVISTDNSSPSLSWLHSPDHGQQYYFLCLFFTQLFRATYSILGLSISQSPTEKINKSVTKLTIVVWKYLSSEGPSGKLLGITRKGFRTEYTSEVPRQQNQERWVWEPVAKKGMGTQER